MGLGALGFGSGTGDMGEDDEDVYGSGAPPGYGYNGEDSIMYS